ncbi:MAG: pseudouridine synthase [Opitutaceae bacterium]
MAEAVRVQKFLAEAGVCSRRAAEALVAQHRVWVNGEAAALGAHVVPGTDRVVVDGKPVRSAPQPLLTLAVNKPRGLACTNADPHNPDTVFSLVPRELARLRFFCAGRLDKESEGLVILTTDGELANRLMHPSHGVVKRYHVTLKTPFPASRLGTLIKGVVVDGERLRVERASLVNPGVGASSLDLDVHLRHGRKREIRQLFGALRYDVRRLRRYQIGAIRLQGIPLRGGKQLSTKEVSRLFHCPPTPRAAYTVLSDSP